MNVVIQCVLDMGFLALQLFYETGPGRIKYCSDCDIFHESDNSVTCVNYPLSSNVDNA